MPQLKRNMLVIYSSAPNIMFYLYCVRITVGSEPDSAGGSSLPGTLATAHNRLHSVVNFEKGLQLLELN